MITVHELDEVLQRHFGHGAFRPGQREMIQRLLAGRSVLGMLSTGGGKSLIYQLPSLLLPGITVVVSPLIALMIDQVQRLRQHRRIPAVYLNSTLQPQELRRIMGEVRQGQYKLVYISPEKLCQPSVLAWLKTCGVSLVAIDEAHCISQWGHDFRTDYLRLPEAVAALGHPPVLAVTATATPAVREEISTLFSIAADDVIVQTSNRPNIAYDIIDVRSEADKKEQIIAAIKTLQGPGMIYCRTRQAVDRLVEAARAEGITRIHGYHAGMNGLERVLVQEQYLAGELDVIVATNAFGMGIDKGNIRYVLHYHLPPSLEEYAQEVGRTGRDGAAGYAALYYLPEDIQIHQHMMIREMPTPEEVERLVALLSAAGGETGRLELAAQAGVDDDTLDKLLFYADECGLIEHLTVQRERVTFQWGKMSEEAAIRLIRERLERIRRMKGEKLQQLVRWLRTEGCYRQALTAYFDGRASGDYLQHCCTRCGIDRSAYLFSGNVRQDSSRTEWDLTAALRQLLPHPAQEGGFDL